MHVRSRRITGFVAAALASITALAACGSSSKSGSSSPTTAGSGATSSTAAFKATTGPLGTGVTDKTIKVGVAIVDFVPIQQFVDFNHGDEEATSKVMIDYFNKHGGFGGRTLDATYMKYTAIGSAGPNQVCTAFTEDQKVFAVLGNIEDPTGAGQACVSKQHSTVFLGHDLTDVELNNVAKPGLMLTTDIAAERRLNVLLNILAQQKTLAGKKVAVLAETATAGRIKTVIDPALQQMGVQKGSDAVLATGSSTDTTAAQAQLDAAIEKWKTEGVNAVLISGPDVVSKQFVEKLVRGLPGTLLLTDATSSATGAAQDEVTAKVNPNPYEGMLTANGLPDQAAFETPTVQNCVKIYEDATGTKVIAPKDLKPGSDGKRVQVYVAVEDICRQLTLFKQITDKIGPYLNNDNWAAAVASLGVVPNLPYSQYATIHTGKYDADDTFGLAKFESSANDFVLQGNVTNAAG